MLELFLAACGAGTCIVLMMLIAKDFSWLGRFGLRLG